MQPGVCERSGDAVGNAGPSHGWDSKVGWNGETWTTTGDPDLAMTVGSAGRRRTARQQLYRTDGGC